MDADLRRRENPKRFLAALGMTNRVGIGGFGIGLG